MNVTSCVNLQESAEKFQSGDILSSKTRKIRFIHLTFGLKVCKILRVSERIQTPVGKGSYALRSRAHVVTRTTELNFPVFNPGVSYQSDDSISSC